MNMNLTSLIPAYPEIVIAITIGVVLMADLYVPRERKIVLEWISMVGMGLAAALSLALLVDGTRAHAFSGMFVADPIANVRDVDQMFRGPHRSEARIFRTDTLGPEYLRIS